MVRFLFGGSSATDGASTGGALNIFHALVTTSVSPNTILHHLARDMSENPNTQGDTIIIIPMASDVQYPSMAFYDPPSAESNVCWNVEYGSAPTSIWPLIMKEGVELMPAAAAAPFS